MKRREWVPIQIAREELFTQSKIRGEGKRELAQTKRGRSKRSATVQGRATMDNVTFNLKK